METDEEIDEIDINQEYFVHEHLEEKNFFEYFQRFLPKQTILYIQYCLLRIPLFLIYDYLFSEQFHNLIQNFVQYSNDLLKQENQFVFQPIIFLLNSSFFHFIIYLNLNFSIPILGCLILIIFLLCSDRRLVIIYSYMISFIIFYFYFQTTYHINLQLNIFILQFFISSIYIQMLNMRTTVSTHPIQRYLCHFAPIFYFFLHLLLSNQLCFYILNIYYFIWISFHFAELILYQYKIIYHFLRYEIPHELIDLYQNIGLQALLNYLQEHIHFVILLKSFWFIKILLLPLGLRVIHIHPYLTNLTLQNETILNYNQTIMKTIYFTTIFYGTETVFTLISLACLVSSGMKILAHRLFRLIDLWSDEVEQIGTIIGIMFFLLLFQSNLTQIDLNRRHIPLLKAFNLLFVALFHFLHTILEPQLLKVAMQTMTKTIAFEQTKITIFNRKILASFRHRYVYTCFIVLILQIFYIYLLWHLTNFSTWLLAITAFLLELIVRLIASLAQYILYVLDAHNCLKNIESFDEYIFLVKAISSIFEFILGVFLLFNGLYILFYEARGAFRALMLAIHAHLNIIKNIRRGWQILRNRRFAWDIVKQLPLANQEQIDKYNDICSICHNELILGNTCLTPCSHLFHQKCLQKAFYATQNCALCSRAINIEGQN